MRRQSLYDRVRAAPGQTPFPLADARRPAAAVKETAATVRQFGASALRHVAGVGYDRSLIWLQAEAANRMIKPF